MKLDFKPWDLSEIPHPEKYLAPKLFQQVKGQGFVKGINQLASNLGAKISAFASRLIF